MNKNLDNNNDGLENFFHDRLHGYKDEPSLDMWDRINSQIPEKPKRNYKPMILWASRAVAACLILSLGFFNYQYKNQLDAVSQQLANMDVLEQRLNDFQANQNYAVAVIDNNEIEKENHINTSIQEVTKYYPQIVYLPSSDDTNNMIAVVEKELNQPKQVIKTEKKNITNTKPTKSHTLTKPNNNTANMPIMAFASNPFNQIDQKDILNLNKKILSKKNSITVNKKKLKMPSQFILKRGNWAVGNNNTGVAVDHLPVSHSKSAKFQDQEIASIMESYTRENKLKKINLDNIVGLGANYSINNNISVFMGPDYMENLKKPRTLSTNNLYPYPVGIESGVTYHF